MMKIIGYSERGAMNALFYRMAYKKTGKENMREFLKLANIENPDKFSDFEIYNEFSLSEFGDPDLVIIAKQKEGKSPVVFFIEAKVSACNGFRINTAYNNYKKINCDTSNLFYQIKQKEALFNVRREIPTHTEKSTTPIDTVMGSRNIGNNPVVRKFADYLKECSGAEYIAIIPAVSGEEDEPWKDEDFPNLRIVYWEDLYAKFKGLKPFIETIEYNQAEDPTTVSKKLKSQIMNKPVRDLK